MTHRDKIYEREREIETDQERDGECEKNRKSERLRVCVYEVKEKKRDCKRENKRDTLREGGTIR